MTTRRRADGALRLLVLCPHFAPDTAPTGVVMTRLVEELAARGHEIHVVTALPWYRRHRIEDGWGGRRVRVERTEWGSITRVHPFPGTDRRDLVRRALGFVGFSALVAVRGLLAGRPGGPDAIIAMSPPLTLGPTAWLVGLVRRARFVFNVQDVFPDAAIATGAVSNPAVIAAARFLERWTYRRARFVTVLSSDLERNVRTKLVGGGAVARRAMRRPSEVAVVPNFVDVDAVRPADRSTSYRAELGIGREPVVMYAGNVGFSQPLGMIVDAARARPDVVFVINGEGAARAGLERAADGLANVRFVDYQPTERLGEVLASADVHVVLLKAGLGEVSVPSKTYSIMAAGRPIVAAVDADCEVTRLIDRAGCGIVVAPEDAAAFVDAVGALVDDPARAQALGAAARTHVLGELSPAGAAAAYEALLFVAAGREHPTA
jgi:colanic acid biosynthesis glycosyl transferase WcaI